MPHFFINSKNRENELIKICDAENYRHIARSLRARIGEKLLLIDENRIQYETVIQSINSEEISCKIIDEYVSKKDLEFDLYLAQSPLRSDAQITLVEKATELGIRGIYPIITDNCTLNKELVAKKQQKWQKVMFEASKQCERAIVPTCFETVSLSELLEKDFDKIVVFGERATESNLKNYLQKNPITKSQKVLIIVGPEGGFSKKEFDFFYKNNLPVVSLGNLILKAETATIVAIGDIIYEYQG